MEIINIHAAKTHLSRLIRRALNGEDIVIGNNGEPLVHLTPHKKANAGKPRKFGKWKGKVWISPDFNAPDPRLESLFYDGPLFPEKR